MMTSRAACIVLALLCSLSLTSTAYADRAAVVLAGGKQSELDVVMTSSREIIVREGWEFVEHKLPPERITSLIECLKGGAACVDRYLDDIGADRLIVLDLRSESYKNVPARVLLGRLLRRGEFLTSSQRYCEKCRNDLLADATRSLVGELVRQAKATINPARLSVRSTPSGALVKLDGNVIGLTEIQRTIAAGTHALVVEAEGHEPYSEEIKIVDGQRRDVNVKLVPLNGSPPIGTLPPITHKLPTEHKSIAPWFLVGAGAIATVAGVVLFAIDEDETSNGTVVPEYRDTALSGVLVGVGGVALLGGGVVWLLSSRSSDENNTAPRPTATVEPERITFGIVGSF